MASYAEASSGVDALSLANMILSSAGNAMTHRKNCEQLAEHVRLVGNMLEQLRSTDLMNLPDTKEPLDGLEEALRKALELVESCREKSCLYMLAKGWNAVYQFRQVQTEIDRHIRLVPLISLVHEFRMQNIKEGLQAIEEDEREYTLEEEDIEAQDVILKPDRTKQDSEILEKSLYRVYPDLQFHEALKEERDKLNIELLLAQTNNDLDQCRLIEHLIDVTKNVVNAVPSKKIRKLLGNEPTYVISRYISNAKASYEEYPGLPQYQNQSQWQADLFDCCKDPCLSLKTCVYPCGTFSRMANLLSKGQISHESATNDLVAYSLCCGCCCYTGCVRKKLREHYNIVGSSTDDFLTHLMCCCCALVQEWRELEIRGFEGCQGRKMIPPPYQFMKP